MILKLITELNKDMTEGQHWIIVAYVNNYNHIIKCTTFMRFLKWDYKLIISNLGIYVRNPGIFNLKFR
uniref:Uncharacterized protein n=1 Tax=Heterorhabditis bacteriophora TaxID=37862 RepID=A0A1I7X7X6_HETBA